ncbi:MAG TPA: DUF1549 and DUF1553 domain-containing protein [Pirellulales bacterium]|nr:DUF1549 and DUF1553 domain-containing protein [Pirellulales bacterium]
MARAEETPAPQPRITFELDVLPVLTATGCNQGACHGKSRGQNGFQLSLLGFDADFDYTRIVQDARGRRVFPAAPEQSLLLRKAAAELPHGGGERLRKGSDEYQLVRKWIEEGMPRRLPGDPELRRISLAPAEHKLAAGQSEQICVTAHYSDGSTRDVTRSSTFQSNESAVVAVDRDGMITAGTLPGEAAIMARYMGHIATWNTLIPLPDPVADRVYDELPRKNFIDDLVWAKLKQLGVTPSESAGDSTFLRRAYLDVIGRLPTAEEARTFLEDPSPSKRERLVDALLVRDEYADFWANKWADLLRPNAYRVGVKATFSLDAWLRDAFRRNLAYDQFVRELVTARGSTWRNGAVTLFRDRREPPEITTAVSQLFLGIRLECAKCHHHPFESWGQDDFYGFAAFFARIGHKGTGLSPPISGGEEMVFAAANGAVAHPTTGETVAAKALFGSAREPAVGEDPREALADWMLSPDNPYFAKVAVNRVWADLMGRGLVDPVDDLRVTNPAANEPLLSALGEQFRREGFDLKWLLRTIMTSHVYGLSSTPNERNVADTRNYSRHYRQRLRAEVLLDAISDITEVPETFAALPSGSRATEIWSHRVESLFLDAFGRPDANQDPPCERTAETTMVQTLHLMNAPNLHNKVTSDNGRAARLAASDRSVDQVVAELYLLVYSRLPTSEEREIGNAWFASANNRRQATEDLLWALLNTPEFLFKD